MDGGNRKYAVELTDEQRRRLEDMTRNGTASAKQILHARILLMSDQHHPLGRWKDEEIARSLGAHVNTIARIRKRFALEGEEPALHRKVRLSPPTPPKLDGTQEAYLVAMCCSPPPKGRARWTLRLLAHELAHRKIVVSICAETVRQTLKKTACSRGARNAGAFRSGMPRDSSRRWKRFLTCTPRTTLTMSR
jgi:transposase